MYILLKVQLISEQVQELEMGWTMTRCRWSLHRDQQLIKDRLVTKPHLLRNIYELKLHLKHSTFVLGVLYPILGPHETT